MKKNKKFLDDVPFNNYFNLKSGSVLKSLRDLHISLPAMDDATFSHHVNPEKNDFSTWVKDVIGDNDLADEISKLKSKKAIHKLVGKRIRDLEKVLVFPSARKPAKKQPKKESLLKPLTAAIKKRKRAAKKKPLIEPVKEVLKKSPKKKPSKKEIKAEEAVEEILEQPKEVQAKLPFAKLKEHLSKVKFIKRSPHDVVRDIVPHPYFREGMRDFLLGIVIGFVIALLLKGFFC